MPGSAAEATAVRRLLGIYEEAEAELTRLVDNRLQQGITYAGWNERKLLEVSTLRRELQAELAAIESKVGAEVRQSLEDVYRDAARSVERQLGAGVVGPVAPRRAVMALEASLTSGLTGTHFAILRAEEDVYRRVVAEAAERGVVGVETRDQIRRRMVDQFYERGVRGFVDKRGRRWTLRSYTEMASRTAMAQAHLQGTVDRLAAHGIRLAKISRANNPCELCRPWEGRVLIVSGPRDGEHATLDDARAAGLYHPRCTHGMGAYIPELQEARRREASQPKPEPVRLDPPDVIPMDNAVRLDQSSNPIWRWTDANGKDWLLKKPLRTDAAEIAVKRELAADAVAQRMSGFVDAPRTYGRVGSGGEQLIVSEYRSGAQTWSELQDSFRYGDPELERLTALVDDAVYDLNTYDYVIQNVDRHAGNYLVDRQTGKLTSIDHDNAQLFKGQRGLEVPYSEPTAAGQQAARAALDDWDALEQELTELGMEADDIAKMRERLTNLATGPTI